MESKLTDKLKQEIAMSSAEARRLHVALHEAFRKREEGEAAKESWKQAAEKFRREYDHLAFPGGYYGALDRISIGDPYSVEAAICFLELRPFFFRSGYMFKDLLRKCRKAPLSQDQQQRFKAVEANVLAWRKRKQEDKNHNHSKL